ncbi:hypothetical protein BAUCODRAFT_119570 [Baudoinia panamericana UAMH 10762]|uniref:Uncharacterized protein n=1 Tax=Baudoinia panamericana (strain UAMH 10762) TaxID=717646 RepID=M2NKM4_BAUPA|nr:uncharacterized protein BAUCODRAFT_119570 [Baudoinia panamericana UAMH 10762]EMC99984.1 hypothetical protein BAUCODRAFT_119570 [Baudoinia panamericana UAMH 10762]
MTSTSADRSDDSERACSLIMSRERVQSTHWFPTAQIKVPTEHKARFLVILPLEVSIPSSHQSRSSDNFAYY